MDFIESLKTFTKAEVKCDYALGKNSGYGTGGRAKYYIEVNCVKDVRDTIEFAKTFNIEYKVVGNCTNILVADGGVDYAVINLKRLNDIKFSQNKVVAMAGASISSLSRLSALNGYLENTALCGIPATIGGAVVMNAGAFNNEIADNIIAVTALKDGKLIKFDKWDCEFGYRTSRFLGNDYVIISAEFSLNNFVGAESAVLRVGEILRKRKTLQPQGKSCGSVFKNGKNYFAGEIIDRADLKGYRVGGAYVSNKHANFILTDDTASSQDVKTLIQYIKERIKSKYDINLVEEIEYLGEFI